MPLFEWRHVPDATLTALDPLTGNEVPSESGIYVMEMGEHGRLELDYTRLDGENSKTWKWHWEFEELGPACGGYLDNVKSLEDAQTRTLEAFQKTARLAALAHHALALSTHN